MQNIEARKFVKDYMNQLDRLKIAELSKDIWTNSIFGKPHILGIMAVSDVLVRLCQAAPHCAETNEMCKIVIESIVKSLNNSGTLDQTLEEKNG